jgi:3-mercaptopyruvate sulfurtransferase SseA
MQRIKCILFMVLMFVSALSACSAQPTQVQATPTQLIEPVLTQSTENLPQSEAEVPRVSVEEARVAFESGTAVIVDVRSPGAFESSHIAGAISVPLGEIEQNPTGLILDKEQWIITYCT